MSGLSTSVAATHVTPRSRRSSPGGIDARQPRQREHPLGRPPAPASSRRRTPRACAMPAPASLVALPPRPTISRTGSRSSAAAISSPVPRVVVTRGSRRGAESSSRPDAEAISTIATTALGRVRDAERGLDLVLTRARYRDAHHFALQRVDEGGHGSLAAVGHRRHIQPVVRARPSPSGRHRLGGLTRRERATELVGRHEDAHPADATIPRRTRPATAGPQLNGRNRHHRGPLQGRADRDRPR